MKSRKKMVLQTMITPAKNKRGAKISKSIIVERMIIDRTLKIKKYDGTKELFFDFEKHHPNARGR